MPSPEYDRFLASMNITYVQWHDGDGYDLEALAAIPPEDRSAAEQALVAHLRSPGDWRDVEALAALGTPTAMEAVKSAKRHGAAEVRNKALEILSEGGAESAAELEDDIVHAVERGALDLALGHPTPRIKRALLDCARLADATTRVNAAAMLLYLCGQAPEPFDWNQRDFFLRFRTEDPAEMRAAWAELRQRSGI